MSTTTTIIVVIAIIVAFGFGSVGEEIVRSIGEPFGAACPGGNDRDGGQEGIGHGHLTTQQTLQLGHRIQRLIIKSINQTSKQMKVIIK